MTDILKTFFLSGDRTFEEKFITFLGLVTYCIIGLYIFGIIDAKPKTIATYTRALRQFFNFLKNLI
jgi:hypothetical protein